MPEPARDTSSPHADASAPHARPDAAARHISPYSRREKVARLLWAIVQGTLYRYSFTTWYRFRVSLLRLFGAKVHATCRFRRLTRFECPWNLTAGANTCTGDHTILYCLGPVTLGERVTISQHAHICAGSHDFTRADLPLLRPPITIGDDVWIAADAFVGPNVTIGERALLGARACAFKDLPGDTIYGGNPAKPIRPRPPIVG
jgi:putative colanic acid biosynthesis acetyltransferase WcaF